MKNEEYHDDIKDYIDGELPLDKTSNNEILISENSSYSSDDNNKSQNNN